MTTKRFYASVAKSEDKKIVVTGGYNREDSILNTGEMLTEYSWIQLENPLLVQIYFHCSVFVNDTSLMLIGGEQGSLTSNMTQLYDFKVIYILWCSSKFCMTSSGL